MHPFNCAILQTITVELFVLLHLTNTCSVQFVVYINIANNGKIIKRTSMDLNSYIYFKAENLPAMKPYNKIRPIFHADWSDVLGPKCTLHRKQYIKAIYYSAFQFNNRLVSNMCMVFVISSINATIIPY